MLYSESVYLTVYGNMVWKHFLTCFQKIKNVPEVWTTFVLTISFEIFGIFDPKWSPYVAEASFGRGTTSLKHPSKELWNDLLVRLLIITLNIRYKWCHTNQHKTLICLNSSFLKLCISNVLFFLKKRKRKVVSCVGWVWGYILIFRVFLWDAV